ncbi:MAG TPA: NAD(P)-dependent oxidoreductase [Candidatus Limnocylindrales bacterium]|jgi:glutamate synthase (NADPH/NADH) small chain|nr:NAD(P)-dependent oxidoreductase [Candidatus Limnocylindrales bacterium]
MSNTDLKNLNSKYAWRELAHQGLPKRSAAERAADFLEIYGLYDEATAREQASRCIQCPNPTCVAGCPLCNPIPQWMLLTAEGRFLEAAALLGSVTNMAEICARVCPSDHLCEGACLLEAITEPVPIQALEQFLIEYAFAHGQVDASTAPPNGLKVAVVGSGPGGLACAEQLAKKGYAVTVFDSEVVPGGLLVNDVPAFKLDKSILQRRLDLLKKQGVVFRLGVKLWQEVLLTELREEFDAVFLGWDSRRARPLDIPGANLKGVVQAVPFLLQKTTALPLDLPRIDVAGRRVVVIGAGDTAMDCLRAAIRYGASEVLCVYRRDEPDMPCGRLEYKNAVEEGARFVFCAAPVEILGNENGQVSGLRLVRTEIGLPDGGRRPYLVQSGTEFDIEADWVIPALGFDPLPCPRTDEREAPDLNDWGGIVVNEQQMTSIPGVFAGGDLVRGPSLMLHSVRDARKAAEQIDCYLRSKSGQH